MVKRTLDEELSFFRKMSEHPDVWDQAVDLLRPYEKIRIEEKMSSNIPTVKEVRDALRPLEAPARYGLHFVTAAERDARRGLPDTFIDLTDILRASPLKEEIPPGHLFGAISIVLGGRFIGAGLWSTDRGGLCKALLNILPMHDVRWHDTLQYNYGGLFVHILWHGFAGQADKLAQLAPLARVMEAAPVLGRRSKDGPWEVLAPLSNTD